MKANNIVHFVSFETALDREQFIKRWEDYNWSVNVDRDITLLQSEKKGMFRYIAQHRCAAGGLSFMFTKAAKSPRLRRVEIKTNLLGGYSILQEEQKNNTHTNDSKIFVFVVSSMVDLNVYKRLSGQCKLNIYEAYYENCQYSYILEFFVRNKDVTELLEQLQQYDAAEIGMYKECIMQAV